MCSNETQRRTRRQVALRRAHCMLQRIWPDDAPKLRGVLIRADRCPILTLHVAHRLLPVACSLMSGATPQLLQGRPPPIHTAAAERQLHALHGMACLCRCRANDVRRCSCAMQPCKCRTVHICAGTAPCMGSNRRGPAAPFLSRFCRRSMAATTRYVASCTATSSALAMRTCPLAVDSRPLSPQNADK